MASLATALKASGTEYIDELTYRPGMALRSANCTALEKGGMQVMKISLLSSNSLKILEVQYKHLNPRLLD